MFKVTIVIGTRPEIIKTWPIIKEADKDSEIDCILIHTGQHYDYEMSQVFFEDLSLRKPDIFLEAQGTTHGTQTASMIEKVENFLLQNKPDVVGVLGDTNSALAGALAASKLKIPVSHFEAGCRSFDRDMPEELNRLLIDSITSILYAPSNQAETNLLWEGQPRNRIFMCGNTQSDVLNHIIRLKQKKDLPDDVEPPYGVITIHRAENTDNLERLAQIVQGFEDSPIPLIFPVHPRTRTKFEELNLDINNIQNMKFIKPLGYQSFIYLLQKARFVITDSGGIQEEAAMLNIPCLTVRNTSEWPETILHEKNLLIGDNPLLIKKAILKLHNDQAFYQKMSKAVDLYEKNAGKRIISVLKQLWNKNELHRPSFKMLNNGYPEPYLSSNEHEIPQQNVLIETLSFKNDGYVGTLNEKVESKLQLVKKPSNCFNPEILLE